VGGLVVRGRRVNGPVGIRRTRLVGHPELVVARDFDAAAAHGRVAREVNADGFDERVGFEWLAAAFHVVDGGGRRHVERALGENRALVRIGPWSRSVVT